MIQRIQSLYLLMVIIAYSLLFFFPIASYKTVPVDIVALTLVTPTNNITSFSLLKITSDKFSSNSTIPLIAVVVILALAVMVTIFLYKKRLLQIKITAIILLAHIGFIAALFYFADSVAKKVGVEAAYETGAYIALIPLVFLVLANRSIRRDEKMVRSTDRLR
jgi:hypothetical protein